MLDRFPVARRAVGVSALLHAGLRHSTTVVFVLLVDSAQS